MVKFGTYYLVEHSHDEIGDKLFALFSFGCSHGARFLGISGSAIVKFGR
jgi:hypothetical protein